MDRSRQFRSADRFAAADARRVVWLIALLIGLAAPLGCQRLASAPGDDHGSVAVARESSAGDVPGELSDGSMAPELSGSVPRTPAADPQPEPQADRESAGELRSAAAATAAPAAPPPRRQQNELQQITFEDLEINMAEDTVFDPAQLTDRVKELDGQRIRIKGFISPGIFQQTGIDKFPLVMNTECKFGPGGQADHVIIVELLDGLTTSFTVRPIAVEGRLTLQPWNGPDGNTWALYHLAGEKVQ